ncbi:MAG TPA: acetate kinase [Polyangiaceae bacterium]|nr:acetate kinase [Polyangiaceae bacterium]
MKSGAILVLNSGSSSLKFAVVEPDSGSLIAHGIAERLGTSEPTFRFASKPERALGQGAAHAEALRALLDELAGVSIAAVGHRVVHGGEAFSDSVVLDESVLNQIRACSELAPLHNPANVLGIEAARRAFVELPQVAVFDTAFHQTLPRAAYLYAIPYEYYERQKVRRYGFHGTSHGYVAGVAASILGKPLAALELVTAHLGNGASVCAISQGRSVDTSMGFTPLEGVVMGTRSGDVDPNLHEFLATHVKLDLHQITEMLNKKSGLLGLSGVSNDMRTLLALRAEGNDRARLAIEVFCYRLAKSILALCASLTRVDALVFTGGIGEHAAEVRAQTLGHLRVLGAVVDEPLNRVHGAEHHGRITVEGSALLSLVIPTNEELVIARETARLALQAT